MLRVIVCPSLKPKSSLGVESGACACLLSSLSCFTHLDERKTGYLIMGVINKTPTTKSHILEMILKRDVEVKGIAAVSEADAYERASTWQTRRRRRRRRRHGGKQTQRSFKSGFNHLVERNKDTALNFCPSSFAERLFA